MIRSFSVIIFSLLLVVWSLTASAQASDFPAFSDYPATLHVTEKTPLKLEKADMSFRTRYKSLYQEKPNFAGRYGIATVGCGTECTFVLAVDYLKGKTWKVNIPGGEDLYFCETYNYENDSEYEYFNSNGKPVNFDNLEAFKYEFNPNSRLFVVTGTTEYHGQCMNFYYLETNGRFEMIKKIKLTKAHKSQ